MSDKNALERMVDRAVRDASLGEQVCTAMMTHEDGSVIRLPVMDRGAGWSCGVDR